MRRRVADFGKGFERWVKEYPTIATGAWWAATTILLAVIAFVGAAAAGVYNCDVDEDHL